MKSWFSIQTLKIILITIAATFAVESVIIVVLDATGVIHLEGLTGHSYVSETDKTENTAETETTTTVLSTTTEESTTATTEQASTTSTKKKNNTTKATAGTTQPPAATTTTAPPATTTTKPLDNDGEWIEGWY